MVWGGLSLVWLVSFSISLIIFPEPIIGWAAWSPQQVPSITALVGVLGLAIMSIALFGVGFYRFMTAPLPEIANRAAFWTVTTLIALLGVTLIANGTLAVILIGNIILYLALSLMSYGIHHYRLVDVRLSIMNAARTLLLLLLTWGLIVSSVYLLSQNNFAETLLGDTDRLEPQVVSLLVIAGMSLVVALLLLPLRQVVDIVFDQINVQQSPNLTGATALFSRRLSRAATLEEIVEATTSSLNEVMRTKRSALILINNTVRMPDAVELIVLERGATLANPSAQGFLSKNSPIFYTLAATQVPIGQFDLDFGPFYQGATPDERRFFLSLRMSAFVPVITDDRLIGLIATGPKLLDVPYYRDDMELLVVIAQQVANALRSARLIDDLQHLNNTMRVLNKRLESTNTELEKLDSVKTDFITIASHELRTPLAQIRGYTDIIDSLNTAEALNQDQAKQMVNNLRKSTERMEELISAMLDVSQIDVKAMDLRFVRTTPETVVRMALEPLKDPATQRNITIEREGLGGLPHIQADMQRLVQAFRNILLNAIKFTPDGGHIHIAAEQRQSEEGDFVVYSVKDTGVGVDPKDSDYIFEKFYRGFDTQLHSTGIYKFLGAGPGLGLTIAKGIIDGHGGKIWVESSGHNIDDPPGSIFYIQIPITQADETGRVKPIAGQSTATRIEIAVDELDTKTPSEEINVLNTRLPNAPSQSQG